MEWTRENLLVLFLFLVVPRQGAAQEPRNGLSCDEAVRQMQAGVHDDRSFAVIPRCPDGPRAIADRWLSSPNTLGLEDEVSKLTAHVRDQRIADAAFTVAVDRGRTARDRLLGLQVFLGYSKHSLSAPMRTLLDPGKGDGFTTILESWRATGNNPPAADTEARLYSLARTLSSDPDPVVSRAGRFVWQGLTDRAPQEHQEMSSSLTLGTVCGRKFRVANQSDIDLTVMLYGAQRRIPARGERTFILPRNEPAVLSFGGRDIARATTGAPCS